MRQHKDEKLFQGPLALRYIGMSYVHHFAFITPYLVYKVRLKLKKNGQRTSIISSKMLKDNQEVDSCSNGFHCWTHHLDFYCYDSWELPETEQGVAQAIIQFVIDFKAGPWPKESDTAKDLFKKMLDRVLAQSLIGELKCIAIGRIATDESQSAVDSLAVGFMPPAIATGTGSE